MAPPLRTRTSLGRIMVDRGWSAADLARVSGVYPRTLTEYLAGRVEIRDWHLGPIADALEVNIEDLL